MKRSLVALLCTLIVPAFQPHVARSAAVFEDVPVPGGTVAFARNLGIDPAPDSGRFVYEVTRLLYSVPEPRDSMVVAFLQTLRQNGAQRRRAKPSPLPPASDLVPIPLASEVWGSAVFHRRVTPAELVGAIVADRSAALLCHGLASLDDATLEYLSDHPAVLTRLYERSAPLFAAFAGSLRIRDGHVVPSGGPDAARLWEAVVDEQVNRPDRFVIALFELYDGRLAYLYDTIGQLDAPHRTFALGTWMVNPARRLERFRTLATAGLAAVREWHVRALPFARQSYDLAMALARIEVDDNGAAIAPASMAFWSRVFGGFESNDLPIDAAWLAGTVGPYDVRQRAERFDQIVFAQRLMKTESSSADGILVVRSYPRFRALLLTLERMGIRNAAVHAAAIRHAMKLTPLEGRRGVVAQAQLQGALALLSRLTAVGTLDRPSSERLLAKLLAITPNEDGRYAGAIVRWAASDLRPVLPSARDAESALVAGLAGRPVGRPVRITWEGQQYRLDFPAAERIRLERVREKQEGIALDVPIQLADAVAMLRSDSTSFDDLEDLVVQLTAVADDMPIRSKEEEAEWLPAGVSNWQNPSETLHRAIGELARAIGNKDRKRLPRVAELLVELEDETLAWTLMSFAYAVEIGDPDGTILLAGDVSRRHDFGFGHKDADARARVTWSIPRQDVTLGMPWHVNGSALGLDVALSSLVLRRVSSDRVIDAPKLTSNARDTFAISVSLLNPRALVDRDRDRIASAIDRGRARVLRAAVDAAAFEMLADELLLDGARRRAMRWTRGHEPERLPSMLSLTELVTLGGERTTDLHAWGMAGITTAGCLCSRLIPAGRWPTLGGRPSLGLSASALPDLNFQVAVILKQIGLPSALAKVVLSAAMQDFLDEAKPTDDDDWLTLSRLARALTRERVEDYVAAAAAGGPLVPDGVPTPDRDDASRTRR